MWSELACGLLAELEMDEFDRIANACCDYEELTDSVNNFCNYEELKDFCSDKLFEVPVSISNKDRLPNSQSHLCLDNPEQFSKVVEKEPTPRFGKLITQ